MRQELAVFQREFIRSFDEAEFFYAYAVEPFAVEGAQVLGEVVEHFVDVVQLFVELFDG